ncbi:hypothetical protein DL95DRAFT_491851 [Leptodontidium sp. 2 PMI_412]|nr:hypothetical protein DL95DRAFT_491851 [Leptodontidium sp. 2 PMI_412]
MGTPTADEEERMRKAVDDVRNSKFPNITAAARKHCVNYDVLRGRLSGRLPNSSRGGKNKKLNDDEEATLVLYYKRLILYRENPGRKEIEAAANSILRAAGKKKVSKLWLSR